MTNDRYRASLTIDFARFTIKDKKKLYQLMDKAERRTLGTPKRVTSKAELSRLMRDKNYHVVTIEATNKKMSIAPTQAQLDYAWQYLKNKYHMPKQEYQRRGKNYVASRDVIIRGKLYHRGQYIPKTYVKRVKK
jgi:hypothetical protein